MQNWLKSASRGHGQAVPTSEAARTSLAGRLHSAHQDRAAGVATRGQKTDARAAPALSHLEGVNRGRWVRGGTRQGAVQQRSSAAETGRAWMSRAHMAGPYCPRRAHSAASLHGPTRASMDDEQQQQQLQRGGTGKAAGLGGLGDAVQAGSRRRGV